jgi:hypothetical protein
MTQAGEYRVCGVHAGGFYIEDLRLLVPQNVVVTISAADAQRSKDLYRGIGVKSLIHMGLLGETLQTVAPPPPVGVSPSDDWRIVALEEQNRLLRELVAAQLEKEATQAQTQQELLQAVGNLTRAVQAAPVAKASSEAPRAPQQASEERVSGDAPVFVPSQVSEVASESRVSVASTETDGTVHHSRNALRKLRGGVQ